MPESPQQQKSSVQTLENNPDVFEVSLTDLTRNYIHQAPVLIPDQSQLTLKLVRVDLVQKLIESKGDFEMYLTATSILIGAVIGAITSIAQEGFVFSKSLIIVLIFASAGTLFFIIRLLIISVRYNKIKREIFASQ